jgi:hypothetical protein
MTRGGLFAEPSPSFISGKLMATTVGAGLKPAPTPLAAAPAAELLPDAPQDPSLIQAPAGAQQFLRVRVAGKTVDDQAPRQEFHKVHYQTDVTIFRETGVGPLLIKPGQG